MQRRLVLLFAVALGTAFLAACNLGSGGCSNTSKTESAPGGSGSGRDGSGVCGDTSGSFTPYGTICGSKGPYTSFLYVGDRMNGDIDTFGLNADGTLALMCHSARMDSDVTTVAVSNNKSLFAYSTSTGHLFGWQLNGPVLTALSNTPDNVGIASSGNFTDRMVLDPLGRYLFLGNVNSAGINVLDVNTLAGTSGQPFPDADSSTMLAAHPNGKFLYSFHGTSISQFAVSDQGVLTPLSTPSVSYLALGGTVIKMKVEPTGKFLYLLATQSIAFYRIDQTTGQLTAALDVGPVALHANSAPADFTFDPAGHFLYVADPGATVDHLGWVDAFSINSSTGALTPIAGQPFLTAIGAPNHVVASPDGQHLWVVVGIATGSQIFGMAINSATGAFGAPAVTPTAYTISPTSPAAIATTSAP